MPDSSSRRAEAVSPIACRVAARRHVQERQIAETAVSADSCAPESLAIDPSSRLREPGDRGLLVAELVDQLEVDRLPAGEHAAVGDFVERCAVTSCGCRCTSPLNQS